ncbi:hypothetical protein BH10CYA1_BH10CYA1_00890 [soil metagenome]
MASEAAIQKRELAVLGKIQTELAFFVDRQTMNFGNRDNSVPKEFDFDSFEIIDDSVAKNLVDQSGKSEQDAQSMPAAEQGPENLEWFSTLLKTASNAA